MKTSNLLTFKELDWIGVIEKRVGVTFYTYRWYDPVTGRWASRDPIGERGGVNLYGFVRNVPISLIDTDGRQLYPGQPDEDVIKFPSPDNFGFDSPPIVDPPIASPPSLTPYSGGISGEYICRRREGYDGSSQEGFGSESGDGSGCCLDARCSYECTPVEGGEANPEGELIEFKFKICGEETEMVNSGMSGNHLGSFCPDTIEVSLTTFSNGTYSTNDIPPNSPPTSLRPGSLP